MIKRLFAKSKIDQQIDLIFDKMGQIFYDFGLVSDNFSFFAGRYKLPLKPVDAALLVGPWLKIEVDMSLLPRGVFLEDLTDQRLLSALKSALGRNVEFRSSARSSVLSSWLEQSAPAPLDASKTEFWYFVEVDQESLRGIRRLVNFADLPRPGDVEYSTLPIPLGISAAGTFEYVDLSHMVSMLVCGATRTGKSVFLRQMLTYLAQNFDSSVFSGLLGDFKFGVEFQSFEALDQYTVMSSPADILDFVRGEMTRRFSEIIKPAGCFSILDFNSQADEESRLPYILVVIDEFAAFANLGGKAVLKDAIILAAQSAGAGLYWIISTQRPSVDIVPGSLKANLGARVSFSLATTIDSEVVFGSSLPDVVQVGCPGRAWSLVGDRLFEFQSSFL